MRFRKVSEAVIKRLPRYYRQLVQLNKQGIERISSQKLAAQMRLNASQVRQDFNCFGGFGQQGYGYKVDTLLREIRDILALNRTYKVIVVGAGNIGRALANFEGFAGEGFDVCALFDISPKLIGTVVHNMPVMDASGLEAFIGENNVDIGVIAARRSAAQELADRMTEAGIRGIWNFAPTDIVSSVPVVNMHLTDSLCELAFRMDHGLLGH